VARRAGVSPTTVSFVLGGRDDMRISEATRQKVLRAVQDLDYHPNLMARSLRTHESRTVSLISDTILTEQYAGELVQGSLMAAAEHGHSLVIAETGRDPRVEAREIDDLIARQVDRFVYASASTRKVQTPRALANRPLVLLNCLADEETPSIVPDEVQGGRDAAQILLAAGHRRDIVLIGETPSRVFAAQARLQGVRSALAEAGSGLAGQVNCNWWPQAAFDAVRELLAAGDPPAALICLNDRVALGAYQALGAAGLQIPDDVSVVSFDDSPLATWLRPQLTTIAIPHLQMGRRAVETLLSDVPEPGVQRIRMPVRHRASVSAPRRPI
jgi:LacI family transcriptional regulator